MAKLPDPVTNNVTGVPAGDWTKTNRLLNTGAVSFYNVKNPDFGAVGDGTTNDTTAIQNCINASSAGDVVFFPPGVYGVSAPIVRKPNRFYIGSGGWNEYCVIKVLNGNSANFQAAGGVSGVFVPESWDQNAVVASGPVTIKNLKIDGNRANNATGQHVGFLLGHGEYWSHYENLYAAECKLDGFRFTPLGKNGSTLMAAGISDFRVRDILATANTGDGFRSVKSAGIFATDVVCDGNLLSFVNDGSGWVVDEAANWSIVGYLHLWNNGKYGLRYTDSSFASEISGVYVEDFGRLGTSGEFLSGVEVKTFNGRSVRLHDCTVSVNVPLSGVTHRGIVVFSNDSDAHAWVHDNEVRAEGTPTSAMQGFVFDCGSGTSKLTLHEHGNHAYGFNAGLGKVYVSAASATFAFDPPRVLTGTASWTPGAIAGNGGAITSITVTDAAQGDTVAVGYNQNLQDGLVLTGEVSAANTVTAQFRNTTAGSLTPTAGTVRATVWKH